MPKVKVSPLEEVKREVLARLDYAMKVSGIGRKKMLLIMMCSQTTYYNRMKEIESLTLGEIWKLEKAAGYKLTIPFGERRKGCNTE